MFDINRMKRVLENKQSIAIRKKAKDEELTLNIENHWQHCTQGKENYFYFIMSAINYLRE